MSGANRILQGLVIFYVCQILRVHYYTHKLHNIPPPTPENNETITVIKTIDVHQTRDHLTQDQLNQIKEDVQGEELLTSDQSKIIQAAKARFANSIDEDLEKIKTSASKQRKTLTKSPLPEVEISDAKIKPGISLESMSTFLTQTSFVDYTDEELKTAGKSVIAGIASLEHYNLDTKSLVKEQNKTSASCKVFLARAVDAKPMKTNYATKQAFAAFIENLRDDVKSITDNLLDAQTKSIILENLLAVGEEANESIEEELEELVNGLEVYADNLQDQVDEQEQNENSKQKNGDSTCLTKTSFQYLLSTGVSAFKERKSIYEALSESVDDLEEKAVSEIEPDGSEDEKEEAFKDMLSLPFYPKILEKIDSSVEFIAGYNDAVDQLIDFIGGSEEGGVGRNLNNALHRLAGKVDDLPAQYEAWKMKAAVTE